MPVTPAALIDFLSSQADRPLSAREIAAGLEPLSRKDRQHLSRLLELLAGEGTLVRLKGDRYSLPRQVNLAVGRVSAHRDGYGFVARPPEKDVFIPARHMREAMHGDRVVARVERGWRGAGPEGRIIRVLERAHQTLVGRYDDRQKFGYVIPADPRLSHDLFIPAGAAAGARDGQMVVARIEVYPTKNRNPEGSVVEILGAADDPEVEILTIAHKYDLPYRFPEEVLAEAEAIPAEVREEELDGREDLRELPLVTIDGETAKDFDDAVAAAEAGQGRIRLWVAIADVGHYVVEGSGIDQEALDRATSVYFPGRAIPMLPERLSNGICSLNPEVDRLAMVAEMLFDRQGERLASRFYPAVIRSRARLTYTEVSQLLEGNRAEADRSGLLPQLQLLAELSHRLTSMRRRRGSLDFDLPEAEILLDLRGRPENIVRAERNQAHRLIEECMLAANEAVATFLSVKKVPLLYRVHEAPNLEKLQAFQEFIAHFNIGLVLGEQADARRLQAVLQEAEGSAEERMINQVLLRSMKQARYSEENVGHFGLAAPLYCHFTSPIRRYPDLIVHRVLRQALRKGALPARARAALERQLPAMGEHTSQRERRAMEAEREIVDLKKCQFMADKIGETFSGIVSGVQPFGFFVELKEFFVEGLVHVSSLSDDFYQYEEDLHRLLGQNRRREFQIGGEVEVVVAKVDLERREIDFALADLATAPEGRRPRRQKGRR